VEDFERDITQVAVNGTTNILRAAKKIPSIRRIVITSSIVAIVPFETLRTGAPDELVTPSSRVNRIPKGPWTDERSAYHAGKVAALAAAERFLRDEQPHFSIVHLLPGYVIGPKHFATDPQNVMASSNVAILSVLLGQEGDRPSQRVIVGLTDTARTHVEALDEEKVTGSELFILDAHVTFDEVSDIVRAKLPAVAEQGYLPLGGSVKAVETPCDTENTVRAFGKLDSYEHDVVDLVKQFLELQGKTV
jgi:nucleoside-diphosphate-sugar epimerase